MPVIQQLINSELFFSNRIHLNLVYGDFLYLFSQEKSLNSLEDCIYKTYLSI